MGRATRSFKLRLSPEGMDLLIEAHCHLIRATRKLIAWGTTLHVAVVYLERFPAAALVKELAVVRTCGLSGTEEHHLGAPNNLVRIATDVAERMKPSLPDACPPSLGSIYLLALQCLAKADSTSLAEIYKQTKA